MKIANLRFRPSRWGSRLLAASGLVILLYAVLGFLVVPAVVKAKLPPALSRVLGREVGLRQVRLNPFTLAVTVDGFSVKEPDRTTDFLGWDRLHLRLGFATLVTRTVVFKEIELVHPFGRVVLERGGKLNYADILARLAPGAPAPKSEPRTLRIDRLSIQGAQVVFLDRMAESFATTLGPLSLELTGFSTGPNSSNPYAFSGRTEAGETFAWSGAFSLDPLASRGTFTVGRLQLPKYRPFYQDQVAFQIPEGIASAKAGYSFQWSEGHHAMQLADGSLELLDLKLAQGRNAPLVVLPRVSVSGVEADLIARDLRIASVSLQDGRIGATRAADGGINLVRLLTPKPPRTRPEPSAPFHLDLKELSLKGFQVAFQDLAPVRPVQAQIRDLDLTLRNLSLDPAGQADLKLSLKLNGKTGISAEGKVAALRPAVDLAVKVDQLELPPFDPYLAPAMDIRLNRGTLSLDGRLTGAFEARPTDFTAFRGNLRLQQFEAADGTRGEPFLGYRSLALDGMEVRTNPDSLTIQSVDLVEPAPRMVVAPDGSTNVNRALKLTPPPGPNPPSPLGAALPPTQGRPFKLSIMKTRIRSGRLSFIDRSLEPNAALVITGLEGLATSLSTEPDSQSELDFRGLAGGIAPLRIKGRAMPLRKDQDTDVTVTIQASELSDFSPYAGKYLGYTIHKGKLDLDAHVQIRQRQLQALLKTRMDQFYLGDKVESPDAVKLPMKLALAILRDRAGVIDLELPVTGSLDDPDLHYGKIILHAILNVMGKIVTSPFTLLAKLGGGQGHDLSYVAFAPGSAAADPVAVTKAQALARALAERPELGLEAEGCADPGADAGALKQQMLEQSLLALKAGAAKAPPSGQGLLPEERAQWLRVAYQRAFPAAATTSPAPPPPPPGEMEQRLLGTYTVTADDLRQLGAARTKALFQLLLDAKVDPGRLFTVTGGDRARKEPGSRVYFSLK